jgi:hypothetical protein
LIGDPGNAPRSEESEEPALPFAVELGSAAGWGKGFAIAALRAQGAGTEAVVALLNGDASGGKVVSLGQTHGNADAPQVAARGNDLVIVVPGSDAGGLRLRLAALRNREGPAEVIWGKELGVGKDSQSFAVELGETGGLLAWDEYDKQHNVLRAASFDPHDLSKVSGPRTVSRAVDDAETPRLAPRPGGFWVGFISHRLPGAKATSPRRAPKPAPSAEDDGPEELLDLGPRWLEIVPVDGQGVPTAPPRVVNPEQSHVLVFDLASTSDGGALLAWRDDRTTPGAEGGSVNVARVSGDGSIERGVIDDDEPGAGIPQLVVDETATAQDFRAWIAVSSPSDATRLGRLSLGGKLIDDLGTDPTLRGADLLAARDGRLLLARPRGLAQEITMVRCELGPPPSASARSVPPTPADLP